MSSLKDIYFSFLNLLYPPQCLHCLEGLVDHKSLLCDVCSTLLDLMNPLERCIHCFADNKLADHFYCYDCECREKIFSGFASVFQYMGAASSIIKKMKYSDMPYLSKGIAAYMISQFVSLDWPIPDVIVPVPISFTHQLRRGYNQSLLIAEEFGKYINIPVEKALVRSRSSYSQAGLLRHQRERLSPLTFSLNNKVSIEGKSVLLIDDVYTTGTTLKCCAEILLLGGIKDIHAMTFCRA